VAGHHHRRSADCLNRLSNIGGEIVQRDAFERPDAFAVTAWFWQHDTKPGGHQTLRQRFKIGGTAP
jgi:hypothetical protein